MNRLLLKTLGLSAALSLFAIACGGPSTPLVNTIVPEPEAPEVAEAPAPTKQPPPESAEPRDIAFPAVERSQLRNGLNVQTVRWDALPIVYMRLVIDSGAATDPDDRQGLASLVASMLEEGTRSRSSAELAEEIDFLGASLWTRATDDTLTIGFRAVSDQLEEAMDLLADVTMNPAFADSELAKLKRRETGRLRLQSSRPGFLGHRAFYGALYGDHPYGRVDTTAEVLEAVTRRDLSGWHRSHIIPNNATLIVVGDVDAEQVESVATRAFRRWRQGRLTETEYPAPPSREGRSVIIVDRPGSVQSSIMIGNLAVPREATDWISLQVANQILGGSAASRLFMDLREERSLTYGAYSRISELQQVGPFRASAEVRTEVTGQAMSAFFEHLERIVSDAAPAEELRNAQRFLSDSFPLQIDTPGKIAGLVAELTTYELAEDYWDSYRSQIGEVSPEQALQAAAAHIDPVNALIVIVGDASRIETELQPYGPVQVVDSEGETLRTLPQQATSEE